MPYPAGSVSIPSKVCLRCVAGCGCGLLPVRGLPGRPPRRPRPRRRAARAVTAGRTCPCRHPVTRPGRHDAPSSRLSPVRCPIEPAGTPRREGRRAAAAPAPGITGPGRTGRTRQEPGIVPWRALRDRGTPHTQGVSECLPNRYGATSSRPALGGALSRNASPSASICPQTVRFGEVIHRQRRRRAAGQPVRHGGGTRWRGAAGNPRRIV